MLARNWLKAALLYPFFAFDERNAVAIATWVLVYEPEKDVGTPSYMNCIWLVRLSVRLVISVTLNPLNNSNVKRN